MNEIVMQRNSLDLAYQWSIEKISIFRNRVQLNRLIRMCYGYSSSKIVSNDIRQSMTGIASFILEEVLLGVHSWTLLANS